MLADAGVLDGEGDLDELAVPTSLQAMIGSRLDGLPAAGQARRPPRVGRRDDVLVGRRRRAARHGGEVDPSLESLEERDVRPRAATSRASPTSASGRSSTADQGRRVRPSAKGAPRAPARPLRRLGAALPGGGEELVEIVAYHLEQACRHAGVGRSDAPPPIERAVAALMQAAEKAERREGIREADRYYARALELVGDEQSEQALELRLGRAGTLNRLGQLAGRGRAARRGRREAPAVGRPDLRGRALIGRANDRGEARSGATRATMWPRRRRSRQRRGPVPRGAAAISVVEHDRVVRGRP